MIVRRLSGALGVWRWLRAGACLALLTGVAFACRPEAPAAQHEPRSVQTPVASTSPSDRDLPRIVFLGTSLTAGLGLSPEQAYPAVIERRIRHEGLAYRVVNAGVSGETSAGALRRIDWLLRQPVAILVVETGANDGLRGQDPEALRANLDAILARAERQQPRPKLVVVGMELPPNYGREAGQRFRGVFPSVARKHGATLIPFLLEGVGGRPELNQADGIHPTAEGQRMMADTVWRYLRPLL